MAQDAKKNTINSLTFQTFSRILKEESTMKFFVLLFIGMVQLIGLIAAADDKSLSDLQQELDDIKVLSTSCLQFSDWFGLSMETIRSEAKEKHPASLEDVLESIVASVDDVLAENILIEKHIYNDFEEKGLIPSLNESMLMRHFETLPSESLNRAYDILGRMHSETEDLEKYVRQIEDEYTDKIFNNSSDTVQNALNELAIFLLNNSNATAAEIETERINVEDMILDPLSDEWDSDIRCSLESTLMPRIEEEFKKYVVNEKERLSDLFILN